MIGLGNYVTVGPSDLGNFLIAHTKHGADVMAAIRDALLGRPWMPPDPAPT